MMDLIINKEDLYSNKLRKLNYDCVYNNIINAENTINKSYEYLTIIYNYLKQIKEDLDSLDKSNILYSQLVSLLKIMTVYVSEIDYTIEQSIYDNKHVIVGPSNVNKEINFAFSFPYNYETPYPIGVPIASVVNNYLFTYKCPILNSELLLLDILTKELIIKKYIITVTSTQNPTKGDIIKMNTVIGIFIENTDNEWTVDIFFNFNLLETGVNIVNLDNSIIYGTLTNVISNTEITNYNIYGYVNSIICYLQYITDLANKYVWDHIDNISYYLIICETNQKLLET